jgi:hypothetical protein
MNTVAHANLESQRTPCRTVFSRTQFLPPLWHRGGGICPPLADDGGGCTATPPSRASKKLRLDPPPLLKQGRT